MLRSVPRAFLNSSTETCEITFRVHIRRQYRNKYDNLKSRRYVVLRSDKNTIIPAKRERSEKGRSN